MPAIAMFYGIIVYMYFFDIEKHNLPHIHVTYAEHNATIDIKTGELIDGNLPRKQLRLIQAWVEIYSEDLMANWQLAINGQSLFKIKPLSF